MARSWCKVSAHLDSHPKIRRAGNLGRQVFEFVLRRNAELDDGGSIGGDHLAPDYLADVLMMTAEQAKTGLTACQKSGLLAREGTDFLICGWDDEWSKWPLTEAERKRAQRAKARDSTKPEDCPDTFGTERDCPDSHASEKKREEEKRLEEPPIPPESGGSSAASRSRRSRRAKPSDATVAELASVRTVLERLSKAADIAYRGCDSHVRLIVDRLRDGVSELELRAIVAYCADEWNGKPEMQKYLRPETLFGSQTIHRYLDAARSRYARELAEHEAKPKLEVVK